MLEEHYDLLDTQKRAVIMENRLKQLEAEENRTLRNQRKAEEKALKMLQARQRHYNDLMEKM